MTKEVDELREATREAHAAIRDMRQVRRELNEALAHAEKRIHNEFEQILVEQTVKGLAEFKGALFRAIEKADKTIEQRFNKLADLMLGETRSQRSTGPGMEGLIREHGGQAVAEAIRESKQRREEGL